MDLMTVIIFVGLVFATIGVWVVTGYIRYRSYFQRVRHLLVATGSDDIWQLPPDRLAEVDDVVRRCYFAHEGLPAAGAQVLDVLANRQG